jgi:hypothetical protein
MEAAILASPAAKMVLYSGHDTTIIPLIKVHNTLPRIVFPASAQSASTQSASAHPFVTPS